MTSLFAAMVAIRMTIGPLFAFAPVTLQASVSVKEGRLVRAELDCDTGYYSSSSWERDDRTHFLSFRQGVGGECVFTVVVVDDRNKVIGFKSIKATVIGREGIS